ncbi:hypothetical protein BVC71_10090 [Marivivens niveibacter]|uniref:DUF4258 domain-containing protein n=2 Tax=Marivivens niveibacter TaxID=1930667 RepID=A0A251WYC0_9RHOB|nr:hypothetical protein BVC71_10090 [Marivivens niveibacter]
MTEPWSPTNATYAIREIGQHPALSLAYKVHATQRLLDRGITTSDVLYLLRNGYVYDDPSSATQHGYFRYKIQGKTPNSEGRDVAAVVVPNYNTKTVKVVTVMWVDEQSTCAGTI